MNTSEQPNSNPLDAPLFQPLKRIFSNHQFVVMIIFVVVVALLIVYMGKTLAPVLWALAIAYLLEGVVLQLKTFKIKRIWKVMFVFILFMTLTIVGVVLILPLLIQQGKDFLVNLPEFVKVGQDYILRLPEKYPSFISLAQAQEIIAAINSGTSNLAKNLLTGGIAAPLTGFVTVLVYVILVPVMVLFMLKDKEKIFRWFSFYLPLKNPLLRKVWKDVDMQMGNYIRGKFIEILLCWIMSFVTFTYLGLNYSMLLSFLVGISVLIPYIGATVVTIPVLAVALMQWGVTQEFWILTGAYFIIQGIDGNIFVPWIFSEAVNIHPIAIIMAVLVFGSMWGFWGVFFAIPLATVIKAIINAATEAMGLPEMAQ